MSEKFWFQVWTREKKVVRDAILPPQVLLAFQTHDPINQLRRCLSLLRHVITPHKLETSPTPFLCNTVRTQTDRECGFHYTNNNLIFKLSLSPSTTTLPPAI